MGEQQLSKEEVVVAVRLRPLLGPEKERGEREAWSTGFCTLTQITIPEKQHSEAPPATFAYDHVFGTAEANEAIYQAVAEKLVHSTVLEGLHSCLFAYGQTGSGKTYTMGSLTRLACSHIFRLISAAGSDREFLVRMSCLEIYNEVVRDLLAKDTEPANSSNNAPTALGAGLRVLDDAASGGTYVEGLREHGIQSAEQMEQLLRTIEANRTVRDTRMNAASSRSHLIVRVVVESRPARLGQQQQSADKCCSPEQTEDGISCQQQQGQPSEPAVARGTRVACINFVDLSGSERMSQAASEGDADKERIRQKEASNINRSLLTLGSVIRALGEQQAGNGRPRHVPYRDSKLTRILQPALAGNARMAIITTISPAASCADNSRAALHFANAAKKMVMAPQVNEVHDDSKALIKRMQAEIDTLRAQMAALSSKDEEVRKASEEKALLERRLHNLEKLILRGDTQASGNMRVRRSFDGSVDLAGDTLWGEGPGFAWAAADGPVDSSDSRASSRRASGQYAPAQQQSITGGPQHPQGAMTGRGGRGRHPAAHPVRASWNPGSSSIAAGSAHRSPGKASMVAGSEGGAGAAASSTMFKDRLLLDYLLASSTRKAPGSKAAPGSSRLSMGGAGPHNRYSTAAGLVSGGSAAAAQGLHGSDIQTLASKKNVVTAALNKLQALNGPKVEEAMAALQAEVQSMGHVGQRRPELDTGVGQDSGDVLQATVQQLTVELQELEGGKGGPGEPAEDQGPKAGAVTTGGHEEAAAQESNTEEPSATGAMIEAIRKELARLKDLQGASDKAKQALSALDQKLGPAAEEAPDELSQQGGMPSTAGQGSQVEDDVALTVMPAWIQSVLNAQEEDALCERGVTPGMSELSASIGPQYTGQQPDASSQARDHDEVTSTYRMPVTTYNDSSAQQPTPSGAGSPRPVGTGCTPAGTTGAAPGTPCSRKSVAGMRASKDPHGSKRQSMAADDDEDTSQNRIDQYITSMQPSASPGPARSTCVSLGPGATAGNTAGHSEGSALSAAPTVSVTSTATTGVGTLMRDAPSISASFGGGSRGLQHWDTTRVREALRTQKAAVAQWYKAELRRVQAEFRASAAADVAALKEALEAYKDQNDRLEVQKKLLLQQVLKLELALEEGSIARSELQQQVAQLTAERDQAKFEAAQAKAAARAAAAAAASAAAAAEAEAAAQAFEAQGAARPPSPDRLSIFDDDGWAAQDNTPDTLLPRIIELWHELHVPLAYRSRFYLTFRTKELFYSELEHRRLEYKASQRRASKEGTREGDRAARALDWERKSLAQAIKYNLDDDRREALYSAWDINNTTKERKLQLVHKIWHPRMVSQLGGAQRSAELVVELLGGSDATGAFMELVLGSTGTTAPAPGAPTPLGLMVTKLVKKVSTPRGHRGGAGAAGQQQGGQQPQQQHSGGSAGSQAGGGGGGGFRPLTPRRGSFGSIISGLLQRQSSQNQQQTREAASPFSLAASHSILSSVALAGRGQEAA